MCHLLLLLLLLQVVLDAAAVRCGVVLLEPKAIRVLGGRVDALAEAWETQKK
jgi:tudor domain-containing protein 3